MALFGAILYTLIKLYVIALIIRLITEMIQSFSRHFAPPRWYMVLAEAMFVITDPPVKMMRRLIPPLQMNGGIGIDVSVIALFLLLMVLQTVVRVVLIAP